MEIKFKIETLGYLVSKISSNTKRFKIGHSAAYSDKFQELLNKFFFISEIVKEKQEIVFPYSTHVLLYQHPFYKTNMVKPWQYY
ncbi:hypothetical protein ACR79N_12240 [Sphingobacterium siyangense]|uniref:hypothetical protein n=1 Tax=Sphingobacterium siyangense TaxID=459529 RepID=UPI003DA3BF81